ncbi:ester cyclase [Actinokineospora soli]|uniref:Ester cyclase n=1 Tax=Actinokineospora soli TaxID=1048753 RepID=A0ABW2TU83_9PSEU
MEITVAFIAEAVNEGDFTVLDDFAHPELRDLSEPRVFPDGPAGLRAKVEALRRRMPDLYARIRDVRPGDIDSVQVRLEFAGTYAGDPMAPTGHDGRVVRWGQRHLWFFRDGRASAHVGRVDRAAIAAALRC